MNSQPFEPEDLALYAMQLLGPEEHAAVQVWLQENEEARVQLAETRGDLALLALAAATEEPSEGSLDHLLQRVAREPKKVAPVAAAAPPAAAAESSRTAQAGPRLLPAEESPRANPALRLLPWLGWAAAAGLAVWTAQLVHQRDLLRNDVASVNHQIATLDQQTATARRLLDTLQDPSAVRVTLTLAKQKPVPQGRATYNPDRGALVFAANSLKPLASQKTYQLWVIPASGQAPIAAGIFHPDDRGDATVLLPRLPVGVAAKAFGVTIENEGGATSPTMPIILAGAPS